MNKYMIRCDIEGVSGVVSYEQAEPGKPEYDFGLRMFKSDLCACIDGLLEGGADEVVIYDEHYDGRNIDPTWLPERVSFISGKPPYRADWAGGLDASYAGRWTSRCCRRSHARATSTACWHPTATSS